MFKGAAAKIGGAAWLRPLVFTLAILVGGAAPVQAQGSGGLGPEAVWKASQQAFKEWYDCIMGDKTAGQSEAAKFSCIETVMRKYGATNQAIQFSKLLFKKDDYGYMTEFWQKGRVDLINVFFFRANTNDVLFMVNGSPPLVSTEEHLDNIDIKKHPLYSKIVKKYPRLERWQCASFKEMQSLPGGGQSFVFAYYLKDGCNACAVGGLAFIGYDFDAGGVLRGTRLVGLTDQVPRQLK